MKAVSQLWRNLSPKQKDEYTQKAKAIRKNATKGAEETGRKRFRPKGVVNGYLLFKNEFIKTHKESNPQLGAIELGVMAAEK